MKLFLCIRSHDYQYGYLIVCAKDKKKASKIFVKHEKTKNPPYCIEEFEIKEGIIYNEKYR